MIKAVKLMGAILVFGLLFSNIPHSVIAQDSTPPQQENIHAGPDGAWLDPATNLWMSSTGAPKHANVSPLVTGGPDGYGYIWDDSVPLSWIDATNGTNSGLSSNNHVTGPVALPFPFKYYENSYNSIYVTAYGYIGFDDADYWPWQPRIPSASTPNNIVAPYATPIDLANSGSANRVYYKSGGTAPNRYFVVEWYQVKWNDETYTFELIFHENGEIVFQYLQMTYVSGYSCGSIAIEDSLGFDGLQYQSFCSTAPSNKAVRFNRPAPGAHVSVNPQYQGRFTRGGELVAFPLTIRNTGELGSDTYDLGVSSSWPVVVVNSESGQALTDTDGDTYIDTGSISMGGSMSVSVNVQTPTVVNLGDNNTVSILVTSSLDGSKSKTATFQTAVPAPFAQVFLDNANGAMSFDLVQPNQETMKKSTTDDYWGYTGSVAETVNGFVYAWYKYGYNGKVGYYDIEYTLLDHNGVTVRGISKLTNNASATVNTYDYSQAVAVAPNGRIGLAWMHVLYNSGTSKYQYNLFFAVIDSAGNIVSGPTNLTNNTAWGAYNDLNFQEFYSPHITATGDNRFTVAWSKQYKASAGYVEDIYYAIRDSSGGVVKPATQLTNDTPGWDKYYQDPGMTALSGNRVMIAWYQNENNLYQAAFTVLDSAGNLVKAPTGLGWQGYDLDLVQLSSGRILIAGYYWPGAQPQIIYSLLEDGSFSQVISPVSLTNPSSLTGDTSVSVTADLEGHCILTWMDYDDNKNLYYALVDSDGGIVTQPMIFRTGKGLDPYIETNYEGYGNTTNKSVVPTSASVDLRVKPATVAGGPQGGNAVIPVEIGNYGSAEATNVVLIATLDSNLSFIGAVPAPTSVVGNVVTWNLDDMGFLGNGWLTLKVSVPSTTLGTLYPINWTLNSAGPEANSSDNAATTNVMEAISFFLPSILN